MDSKVVRKVLVGIVSPNFCDQRYLRDRDMVIPLVEGETDKTAIGLWIKDMSGFIRYDERGLVKVIREVKPEEYAGHELYR